MRLLLLLAGLLVREGFLLSVCGEGLGFFLGLVEGRWALKALGDDGRLALQDGKHPSNEILGRREFGDDRGVVAVLLMGVP